MVVPKTFLTQAPAWIGIDVSKQTFHAALRLADDRRSHRALKVKQFPRTKEGVAEMISWATDQLPERDAPMRAIMESTGSYSLELIVWILEARPDLAPALMNPHAALYFAKSLSERSKTDKVDACVLARFGAERRPAPFNLPAGAYADARALLRHRDALVLQHVAIKNQASHGVLETQEIVDSRNRILKAIEGEIDLMEKKLKEAVEKDERFSTDVERLRTIRGVGFLTAVTLLAELGDLRRYRSGRQLASFVGLAPRLRQSGTSVNGPARISKAGNSRVRRILFLAAISAMRSDCDHADFYRHLVASGKAPKSALCAVARKILLVARSIMISGDAYQARMPKKNGRR